MSEIGFNINQTFEGVGYQGNLDPMMEYLDLRSPKVIKDLISSYCKDRYFNEELENKLRRLFLPNEIPENNIELAINKMLKVLKVIIKTSISDKGGPIASIINRYLGDCTSMAYLGNDSMYVLSAIVISLTSDYALSLLLTDIDPDFMVCYIAQEVIEPNFTNMYHEVKQELYNNSEYDRNSDTKERFDNAVHKLVESVVIRMDLQESNYCYGKMEDEFNSFTEKERRLDHFLSALNSCRFFVPGFFYDHLYYRVESAETFVKDIANFINDWIRINSEEEAMKYANRLRSKQTYNLTDDEDGFRLKVVATLNNKLAYHGLLDEDAVVLDGLSPTECKAIKYYVEGEFSKCNQILEVYEKDFNISEYVDRIKWIIDKYMDTNTQKATINNTEINIVDRNIPIVNNIKINWRSEDAKFNFRTREDLQNSIKANTAPEIKHRYKLPQLNLTGLSKDDQYKLLFSPAYAIPEGSQAIAAHRKRTIDMLMMKFKDDGQVLERVNDILNKDDAHLLHYVSPNRKKHFTSELKDEFLLYKLVEVEEIYRRNMASKADLEKVLYNLNKHGYIGDYNISKDYNGEITAVPKDQNSYNEALEASKTRDRMYTLNTKTNTLELKTELDDDDEEYYYNPDS